MSNHESAEGVLSRNIRLLDKRNPELAEWAIFLAVHLGADEDHDPASEVDEEVVIMSEFGADFEQSEGSVCDVPGDDSFKTMAEQLMEEERATNDAGALYA